MINLVFSAEPDYDDEGKFFATDLHRKDINVMHLACQEGLIQTVKFILETDPSQVGFKSAACWTPLMTACEAGHTDVISLIMEAANNKFELLSYTC